MHFVCLERDASISGITTFYLLLAEGLLGLGHEFTYSAAGGTAAKEFSRLGANCHRTLRCPVNLWQMRRWRGAPGVNALLCSGRGGAPLAEAARGPAARPPLVCFVHDPVRVPEDVATLHMADTVVALERPFYQSALEAGVAPDRLQWWPRPIRRRAFAPPPDDCFHVVQVTRLSSSKVASALALIAAVPEVCAVEPRLQVTIVGGGHRFLRAWQAARQCNRRLGRQVVRLAGTTTDPLSWMERAHVVVAGGYTCMEALYNGRPAIASGYGWFGAVSPADMGPAEEAHFGDRSPTRPSPEAMAEALVRRWREHRSGAAGGDVPGPHWFAHDHSAEHCAASLVALTAGGVPVGCADTPP